MRPRAELWGVALLLCTVCGAQAVGAPLQCMERFKFRDFVIGAWWGPDPSEANYKVYTEGGFNVLMTYRNRAASYLAGDMKYGPDYQLPDREMELARKLGIHVLLDTYMLNDTPWGGVALDPPETNGSHHPARLAELKWLQKRYGADPMLVGYLLGDNCGLHDYMADNARYLLETAPGLFPWMSTNPDPNAQADVPMPLLTTQNYPFLYQVNDPEPAKRKAFCDRLEVDRVHANTHGMALWPFVNTEGQVSPSQIRFQVDATLAYGAQGLWYFHYYANIFDAKTESPAPLYEPVKERNEYIQRVVGPSVVGCRCAGVFHSAGDETPSGALTPGPGQLVEAMSPGLMVGTLVPEADFAAGPGGARYLMIVDRRTVRPGEDEPGWRRASLTLDAAITGATVLGAKSTKNVNLVSGHRVFVDLRAGDGVLVELAR